MNLREYIEKEGGTAVFYRVVNNPKKSFLKFQEEDEQVRKELVQAVYEKKVPEGVTVLVSDISPYIGETEAVADKIASIVVLSNDPKRAERVMQEKKKQAQEFRSKKLHFLKEDLNDWLEEVKRSGLVKGIILRGDLVDLKRYPSKYSDIDLILLLGFPGNNKGKWNQIKEVIKEIPTGCSVIEYEFNEKGFRGMSKTLKDIRGQWVEIQLISFPDLVKYFDGLKKYIGEYVKANFSHARVLWQEENTASRFLKKVLGRIND